MDDVNTYENLDELLGGLTKEQAGTMAVKLAVGLVGEHGVSLAEIAHCMYDPQPDAELDRMDVAGLDLIKIVNCLIKWTMDTISLFDKDAEALLREEYDNVIKDWHEEHGAESPFINYKE